MIKSAVRLLPGVVASALLLAGPATVQAAVAGWEESGQASWYGGRHNGRRTSSGEIFNENAMTAAHSTLPLGTRVLVTRQDTGGTVVVTITDRQPPKGLRVIDLSRGAAARLGILNSGTGMVTLEPAGAANRAAEVIEVAEAPEDAPRMPRVSLRRRGPLHRHHGRLTAAAGHPYYHAPSVVRVRHSTPHRAARHRL